MSTPFRLTVGLAAILSLGACATIPTGPSVLVLPGRNKTFEQFRRDDVMCRQFALDQVSGTNPNQAAVDSGIRSAAVGTVLGAAAGAAIGGGRGAGVGAGTGLLVGGLAGTGAAEASAYGAQQRYNNAYVQCMYAQGNRVPVPGAAASLQRWSSAPAQRPFQGMPPPPPPGLPPPPPPDAP